MEHHYLLESAIEAASVAEKEGFTETSAALIELALDLYKLNQSTSLDLLLITAIASP